MGLALLAVACGGGEDTPTGEALEPGCEGRGEAMVAGMQKTSEGGLLNVELVAASPLPPRQGPNSWTVEATWSSGEPVLDAVDADGDPATADGDSKLIAEVYMVEHSHLLRKAGIMASPGVFEIPEFQITMNGYWELTVVVEPDEPESSSDYEAAVFGFCID